MLFCFGINLFSSFIPLHVASVGGNGLIISLSTAIPYIAQLLVLPAGLLCDYVDRKYLILFGWFITIPVPLIWFFTNSWEWFIAGLSLYCLTMVCIPAITLYIFDYDFISNKVFIYSLFCSTTTVSSIMAPLLGGIFIDQYGVKTVFIIMTIILTISSFALLPISSQKPVLSRKVDRTSNLKSDFKAKDYINKTIWMNCLLLLLFALEPYIPIFLRKYKGFSIGKIGEYYMLIYIGATLFTWLYGKMDKKICHYKSILSGIIIFIIGISVLLLINNPIIILGSAIFIGVNRALYAYTQALFASVISGNRKGIIYSVFLASRGLIIGSIMILGSHFYNWKPYILFGVDIVLLCTWFITALILRHSRMMTFIQPNDVGSIS